MTVNIIRYQPVPHSVLLIVITIINIIIMLCQLI